MTSVSIGMSVLSTAAITLGEFCPSNYMKKLPIDSTLCTSMAKWDTAIGKSSHYEVRDAYPF